jgi:glutamate-ammonia-ligase adenylyltransferase
VIVCKRKPVGKRVKETVPAFQQNLNEEELNNIVLLLSQPETEEGSFAGAFERLGFRDPEKASALWKKLLPDTGLPPSAASRADNLFRELSLCPDPDMALVNLSRFADASISPRALLDSLFFEKPLCHMLVLIFSCSYYLADILTRNPGYLAWLIGRETLETSKPYSGYHDELRRQVAPFRERHRRLNSIKRYRRREVLRIGTRDILGLAAVEETTAELSFLADAVIGAVAELAFEAEREETGLPAEPWNLEGDFPFHRFSILSMGKLGGTELNYSSDIDLLYIAGTTDNRDESAFYTALARRITNYLTEKTEEGTLYRVDLRLRPDGESGPLVVSTDEHMNYMMRRARPWEKQALLKARCSAGNTIVGDRFLENCERIIYNPISESDPLDEILTMREKAIASLPRRDKEQNVKLMSGGIRDIEFTVQAMLIIHGRNRREVRSRNTLEALERLYHYGLVTEEVREILSRSYRLFRTTEHRLQLLRNVRTHTLPDDDAELDSLSARVSHSSLTTIGNAESFRPEISKSIRKVQRLFDSLFRDRRPGEIPLLLSLPPGEKEVMHILARYGIAEGETAHRFLSSLVYGDFPALENPDTLQAAAKHLPSILEAISLTPDPALSLKNFVRIIKATKSVRSMLELAGAGGDFRRLILAIASYSTDLSALLSNRIELLDVLAAGIDPGGPPPVTDSPKTYTRALKRWYEEKLLHIHSQNPLPGRGPEILGPLLASALEKAVASLFALSKGEATGAALFALGSLGGLECRFGSDLDLVAVMAGENDVVGAGESMRRLVEYARMAGLGPVDLRLRGEGSGSQLVQTLERYHSYFETRAGIWELLAFSKCRFICGNRDAGDGFTSILEESRKLRWRGTETLHDLVEARAKLARLSPSAWDVKHAPGGLYDIDFVLGSAWLAGALGTETGFGARLSKLESAGLLTNLESRALDKAHSYFYLTEHAAALHGITYPPLPQREEFIGGYLARFFGDRLPGKGPFIERIGHVKLAVRDIFDDYIKRLGN